MSIELKETVKTAPNEIPNIASQYFGESKKNDNHFQLDPEFLKNYEGKKPAFGFNGLGEFVFYRTYSRVRPDGLKETFLDTIQRVVEGCYEIQRRHCQRIHIPWDYDKAQLSAQEMFTRMWGFKFLPPGRGMWMMGTKFMWERGSAALNNCGFVSTDDMIESDPAEPFCFLMDMSMLGVGVGFDTKGAGKIQIKKPVDDIKLVYTIHDSREGWVDSVRVLIRSFTTHAHKGHVQFLYNEIRKQGSSINGFGGKASGPSILLELHDLIRNHLTSKIGGTLSSVDITDIMNYIGRCVVAGNVRRCLPKGTLIHLKRGLVPIEKVQVGDLVLTAKGYHPVAENVYQGVQNVLTIKTQMGQFRCTDRHRIAVLTDIGEYEWKRAKELSCGDKMVFVDEIIHGVNTTLPGYSNLSSRGTELVIPGLTDEVAWFLGYIHGDGYVYPGRAYRGRKHHGASVMVPINDDEYYDEILQKVIDGFSSFGNFTIGDQPSQDNCNKKRVISKKLAEYFYKNFKRARQPLGVPECILLGTVDARAAYLAGLLDSDGSTKNRPTTLISSVYNDFVQQVQTVYASLGIPTKLKLRKEADADGQAKWELSLVGDFARNKFLKLIQKYAVKQLPTHKHASAHDFGYPSEWITKNEVDYGRSWTPQSSQMTHHRAVLCQAKVGNLVPIEVELIVDEGIECETYDLSVPDRSEFVAQGMLVHNTAEIAFGDADDAEYCQMKNPTESLLEEDMVHWWEVTGKLYSQERYTATEQDFLKDGNLLIPPERLLRAIHVWNSLNHHRWASNNSIFAKVGMDYTAVGKQIASNGEPGLMWLNNMRDYGRMIDGRQPGIDGRVKGGNPCLEQSLESYELCVSGDTPIQMRNGMLPISQLVGKQVDIWNGDDWSTVTPRITGHNRELYRVHLSDGSYLDTTFNHGWSVKAPGKRIYKRVETKDLIPGSKVHGYSLGDIQGRYESAAFEMGFVSGDGFLDLVDRPKYTRAMAVVCGSDEKVEALQLQGRAYKPQIKEGYVDPYRRFNMQDHITVEQIEELRSVTEPIPSWVFEFDKESLLEFIAGWIESDGSLARQPNTDGYRIYGTEQHMRSMLLLLRRVGINHASVNLCHPAGQITNKGVRKYDLWYVQIPSFECGEIPTRYKVAVKIGSRLRPNPRYPHRMIDCAKKQKIIRVEKLDGLHTTYCFDEPDNHMGVFGNCLTYQCNLVETFPNNHNDADDYMRTLKFAYLYAKTVTLLPTHNPRTNAVTLRNRRIGLSQSGIIQAFAKFGRRNVLSDFCDAGYNEIRRWDEIYSEWLCIQKSIKVTSVKPSGTVSLVAGATPGIHHPEASTYWRRVRLAKDSILVSILKEAGFHIEPASSDPNRTVVVKFAVSDERVRPVENVSIWEQMQNVVDYQRYWADNQVSCTVKFQKHEEADIARVLEAYEDQLKGISFLPHSGHGFDQAPYEPCTPEEVEEYNNKLGITDYSGYIMEAVGSLYCDSDKCVVV